jgi:leukocyte elastase inhibitor
MRSLQALVKPLVIGGLCTALIVSAPSFLQAAPETGGWGPLIRGYNRTGQRLFQSLAKTPGNIVLSPYSVGTAMAMALVGARGETEAEMAKALSLEISRGEVDAANAAVLSSLNRAAADSIQLRIADGLMLARQGGAVSDAYVAVLRRDYAADVFAGTDAATVNAWVRKRTAGKIDSIVNHLDPTAAMVLVDAIYFKAPWQKAFAVDATRAEPFHLRDGEAKVPMMRMESFFHLAGRPGYEAIELPYADQRISMVVMLPDAGTGEVLQRLHGDEMRQLLADLHAPLYRVNLSLPRFKSSFEASLMEPFQQMGMRRAFDLHAADFFGVTGRPPSEVPLATSQIRHRAMIDVAEQGTEAAAATGVGTFTASLQPPLETFQVDRPFLFAIVDDETNAVLFQGRIDDPRQAS